jgi:hypothetical protein
MVIPPLPPIDAEGFSQSAKTVRQNLKNSLKPPVLPGLGQSQDGMESAKPLTPTERCEG